MLKLGYEMTVQEEQNTLKACLQLEELVSRKVSADEISFAFRLLSSGMKTPKDMDHDFSALFYGMALESVSSVILQESIKRIARGEVEEISKVFMPSASELASYCKKLELDLLAKAKIICKAIMNTNKRENVVLLNQTKAISLK
ncbi:hypothetical protein [Bartonella senegalensis]|uniref:hypothetical protein n=1 Tax=Bartonella senegalensis TaxID=1468418 RepID=UPI00031F1D37|nr:hypothetical protein [Bartonella senegalensis]